MRPKGQMRDEGQDTVNISNMVFRGPKIVGVFEGVCHIEKFETWSVYLCISTGHYLYPPVELAVVGEYRAFARAWERKNEIRFDTDLDDD